MPFKCVAIDDELPALELIKNYAARIPELQVLQTFHDAISAGEFLRSNTVDLLFADINMPDINGIELINSLDKKPLIIFTTAYKKFAYEGFELDAVDYLLKPIDFERFQRGVKKAFEILRNRSAQRQPAGENIFVRSEYKMVKIDLYEIDYIEGLEDYIKIYIHSSKPVLTLTTMKAFMEKLPAGKFLRIHRSYIIPLFKISTVMNKKVLLKSGHTIPVSDTYTADLNSWMNSH